MGLYLILALACIIYDMLYALHSIKKHNGRATTGAVLLAAFTATVGVMYFIALQ